MFFGYRNLRRCWATLAVLFAGAPFAHVFVQDFLWGIIHLGGLRARRSPIPIIIILDLLQSMWNEWNNIHYRGNRAQMPIRQLLRLSITHVKALMDTCTSVKKRKKWDSELHFLDLAANMPRYQNQIYDRSLPRFWEFPTLPGWCGPLLDSGVLCSLGGDLGVRDFYLGPALCALDCCGGSWLVGSLLWS